MPRLEDATEWQRSVVSGIAQRLAVQPQYTGTGDDCYKFTSERIFGYVKLFADETRKWPPGGVK